MNIRLTIFLFVALFVGCSSTDFTEDLGDGYLYVGTNRHNHSIVKGFESIVDTNVVFCEVEESYIIGYREKSEWHDTNEELVSKNYGYFVLNKQTGDLMEGLAEEEYIAKTKELGIKPKLK